ncbi:MAG: bifunctional adenosylcobinamide kinase/adenosylcobinamide-phosphate guanylyltransferase [Lachnospiraceae bacterium]|nr:bifunctional adenosylcobinamide kinase/adenosylcobinamide-phosphate guanylyltransferase [Lachnospiraceae bacterium]
MIITIIGTPDSGKSEQAEALCLELSGEGERLYIATMIPFGEEGRERVRRHRLRREGKGFLLTETPFDLPQILSDVQRPEKTTALLECVSNWVANEMFERGLKESILLETIQRELSALAEAFLHLVIVSNRFEKTGDPETDYYIEATEQVNRLLEQMSDRTIVL